MVGAGLLAAPLVAEAYDSTKLPRIGSLAPRTKADGAQYLNAFQQGLRDLGWVEGKNFVFEDRWADGSSDRLAELAADLVRLKVDVILAGNTQAAVAAKNATNMIPIVMGTSGDPVTLGLVKTLAQPGGNVTGLSFSVGIEMFTKELEILKETLPTVRRVVVLSNPNNPAHVLWIKEAGRAAGLLGVTLQILEARGPHAFDKAFAAMGRERAGAVRLAGLGVCAPLWPASRSCRKGSPSGHVWSEGIHGSWWAHELRPRRP